MSTMRMLFPSLALLAWLCLMAVPMTASADPDTTKRARAFVADYEAHIRPLEVATSLAWWQANVRGEDADFKAKEAAQNKLDEALAKPDPFRELKALKEANTAKKIDDPLTARSIDVLYLTYLEKQVDPNILKQMVAKSNAVDKAFSNFRAKVDGGEMTDSEVRKVLKTSKDSRRRQAVWEASKAVGPVLAADLKDLVRLRNQAAVQLGFKNYHALQLFLNEQNGDDLLKLFDELDELTREPFKVAKAEIDAKLAANVGVTVDELRPWHYHDPFFQETPAVFEANLDAPFARADLLKVCDEFYAGIGLPISDVIARSDLYEKKGKNPHAFCTDIDRQGDVRVLANVVQNEYWMGTLLHEFGHSVYSSKNIPRELPYPIRCEAHILTTEGVAMLFEKMSKKPTFLTKMGLTVQDPVGFEKAAATTLRYQLLIFSRWCQVMLRFEKGMYEHPDQDLNKLWWDLVEKYQLVKRPANRNAPDYASKIHIVSAPVYYHNYMMGQLFASQVHHAIAREVFHKDDATDVIYAGSKGVGDFMRDKVFKPGRTLSWDELTKHATGARLNARAFAEDFKGK